MSESRQSNENRAYKRGHGVLRAIAPALLVLLASQGVAHAIQGDDCPTWFPDFRCDRESRPEHSVAPMSMPYLFEDPYVTTELQFVGIWHQYPDASIFAGGDAGVLALQARVAITDRVAFIATKDGYTFNSPDLPIITDVQRGWFNIALGFKGILLDLKEHNFTLTPSLRYEWAMGNRNLLQGFSDGVMIPAASFGWGLGEFGLEKLFIVGDLGGQIPIKTSQQSTSLFYNLQISYDVAKHFQPLFAMNGMYWTDGGNGTIPVRTNVPGLGNNGVIPLSAAQTALGTGPFEGADIFNLGSPGVSGNSLVWLSTGARFPINDHWELGALYGIAVTKQRDIFRMRVTAVARYVF